MWEEEGYSVRASDTCLWRRRGSIEMSAGKLEKWNIYTDRARAREITKTHLYSKKARAARLVNIYNQGSLYRCE